MGHSESGFFPEQAALIDASGIRGMISIEQPCPELSDAEIAKLAPIPTLMVFGDYLDAVPGSFVNWQTSADSCQTFVDKVNAAGGDATMMHLPKLGIRGNSHMLMQDKNSDADRGARHRVDRRARRALSAVRQTPRNGNSTSGFSPLTMRAMLLPEPQACVQPSVPWPVFK